MKTLILPPAEQIKRAAELVCRVLQEKPSAVIALDTGPCCERVYEALVKRAPAAKKAAFFAVKEFEGLAPENPRLVKNQLERQFIGPLKANCHYLSAESLEDYDNELAELGGFDLVLIEPGINARLGFNEPATPFLSSAHRQKLTHKTRVELGPVFGGEELVPAYGLTAGIHCLVSGKEILVLAAGEEKADAVYKMEYGRDDSFVPAAFLQLPLNVTVLLDGAAGSQL